MGKLTHTVKAPVAFFRSADKAPIESLKLHFSPIQEGSGDASTSNVRNILGWTGCNLYKTKRNLFSVSSVIRKDGYLLNDDGEESTTSFSGYTLSKTPVSPQTQYTISGNISRSQYLWRLYFYDRFGNFISRTDAINGVNGSDVYTFITPSDCYGIAIQYTIESVDFSTIKIEPGNNASEYEEYIGETIQIAFKKTRNLFNAASAGWVNNAYINSSGVVTSNNSYMYTSEYTPVDTSTTYLISEYKNSASTAITVCLYDADKNFIERQVAMTNNTDKGISYGTFTTTSVTAFIRFSCGKVTSDWNIRLGSSYVPYEPYGYVWGGYVDPVNGVLAADKTGYTFTGDENWKQIFDNDNRVFRLDNTFPHLTPKSTVTNNDRCICSHFSETGVSSYNTKVGFTVYNTYIAFRPDDVANMELSDWKAWVKAQYANGTPLQVAYELKDNVEYQIDPIVLQTYLDYNNFWSDMNDDTEVEYCFADRLISERKVIMNAPHIESVSGAVASFSTDMKAPVKELKAYFTPVQEGSGDPSPQNERPIHGWTGLNIHDEGKNLIDKNALDGTDKVWWKGGITAGFAEHCVTPLIPVKPGASYYLYRKSTNSSGQSDQGYVCYFGKGGRSDYIGQENWQDNGVGNPHVIPDNVYYIGITVGTNHKDTAYLQLNDLPHEYADYVDGTVIPIEFPATKNLFDEANLKQYDRYINYTSPTEAKWTAAADSCSYKMKVLPNTTYTISVNNPDVSVFRVATCKNAYSGIDIVNAWQWSSGDKICTITTGAEDNNLIIQYNKAIAEARTGLVQVELGSTATPYEPYGTIYGGYVDLTRGKVVSTYQKIILDGISYEISNFGNSTYNGTEATNRGIIIPRTGILTNDRVDITKVFSSTLIPTTNAIWNNPNNYKWHFTIYNHSQLHICFDNSVVGITSDMDWTPRTQKIKEWLMENNIIVVLPLETPIEYDLTPQQIKTLKGQNNIWSDANGNVDVSYWTH